MIPLSFLAGWLALWVALRLLAGAVCKRRCFSAVSVEFEWWRVTVRHDGGLPGLYAGLGVHRKRLLRYWFSLGAATGLLAGMSSVALLISEAWALLRPFLPPALGSEAAAHAAGHATPRLQLALPGVTLPVSHALPLWLGLAVSLALHEAGHAYAAAAEGVRISGAGLSALLLIPAAFVELDSDDLAALSRHSMLRVAAAGAWHNTVLGLACWAAVALLAAAYSPSEGGASSGSLAAVPLGAAAVPLLSFLRLLLGYTASLSLALALLNMAPVHWLDGQQALEALALRPSRPPRELPERGLEGASRAAGSSGTCQRGLAAQAVRWALHAGTALYGAVVLLHLVRMRAG